MAPGCFYGLFMVFAHVLAGFPPALVAPLTAFWLVEEHDALARGLPPVLTHLLSAVAAVARH